MCSFPEFNSYSDNNIPVLSIKNNHSININSYFFENNQNTNHTNQLQDFDFSDFSLLNINNPPSFSENTFNSILEDENNDELNDENNNRNIYISPQKEKKENFLY